MVAGVLRIIRCKNSGIFFYYSDPSYKTIWNGGRANRCRYCPCCHWDYRWCSAGAAVKPWYEKHGMHFAIQHIWKWHCKQHITYLTTTIQASNNAHDSSSDLHSSTVSFHQQFGAPIFADICFVPICKIASQTATNWRRNSSNLAIIRLFKLVSKIRTAIRRQYY